MEIWKNELAVQIDDVIVNDQMICFFINDGRAISLSVSLFPMIEQLSHIERRDCQIDNCNISLHWPAFDFSISLLDYLN